MSRNSEVKTPAAEAPVLPVPKELSRCLVCNEYRGIIVDPSWTSRLVGGDPTVQIVVTCICEGILCGTCNKNRIHRPLSNAWIDDFGLYQLPQFSAWIPCDECFAKHRAEEAAAKQARDTDTKFKTASAEAPLLPVPKGLSRCPVCNEYRSTRAGRHLGVLCICDGIPCPRCKKNRIHRPISNSWDERGGFGHWPYFTAMIPCKECYAKQKAEEAAGPRTQNVAEKPKQPEEDDLESDAEYFSASWARRRGCAGAVRPDAPADNGSAPKTSGAAEVARTEKSQSTAHSTPVALKLATESKAALSSPFVEQAKIHHDIQEQVRHAMAESRYKEARALIEEQLKTIPLDWEPLQEREDCVVGAFWDEEELVAFKNAHRAQTKPVIWEPKSASKLWWLMAATYAAERQYDTDLICLLNAWEYEQDHPRIWMAKGSALNWMDRFSEALDAYRTAATIRSWTPARLISDCYHGQGIAHGGLRRLPEARDAFVRALEIDPGNERARIDLACVLHDLRLMNQRARSESSPTHVM